jgi:hypothetical protein
MHFRGLVDPVEHIPDAVHEVIAKAWALAVIPSLRLGDFPFTGLLIADPEAGR